MKFAGGLSRDPEMKAELLRIDQLIEQEFGQVEAADWK